MSEIYQVKPHEPEEELLSAEDAWQDFLSLRQALGKDQAPMVTIWVDRATHTLVRDLIAAGIAQDEGEVISRAIQSFYVATYPQSRGHFLVVRETQAG